MIIGADGIQITKTKPIVDMRIVMFDKMMVHPQTKEMVMIPMQLMQFQREGSEEWITVEAVELEKPPVGD